MYVDINTRDKLHDMFGYTRLGARWKQVFNKLP